MECQIVWSARSRVDLEDIHKYISNDNPAAAKRVVQRILNRVEKLAKFPLIGERYARVRSQEVRQILSGKYRIFYFVNEEEERIEILRVWHSARQEPPLANGLE